MSLLGRRIFLTALALAFFAFAPLLLAFTAGYRFDLEAGRWVRTGSLLVDSDPHGASVTLNGVGVDGTTPLRIRGLSAGQYAVEIARSSYRPWSIAVSVSPAGATTVGPVTLFRASLPVERVVEGRPLTLSHDRGRARLLTLRNDNAPLVELRDLEADTVWTIGRLPEGQTEILDFDEESAIATVTGERNETFFLEPEAEAAINLTNIVGEALSWAVRTGRRSVVGISRTGTLYRIDAGQQNASLVRRDVRSAFVDDSKLYVTDANGAFALIDTAGEVQKLTAFNSPAEVISVRGDFAFVALANEQSTAMLRLNGGRVDGVSKIPATIDKIEWFNDDRAALIGPTDVWTFDRQRGPALVFRRAERFTRAAWVDSRTLLLSTGKSLLGISFPGVELDPSVTELVSGIPHSSFTLSEDRKTAFLLAEAGTLYAIELR